MPAKKKYFYDTDFLEDGFSLNLISIGIVCEDGREFYAVNSEMDTDRIVYNGWLMNNVMNSIGHYTEIKYMTTAGPAKRDLVITDPAAMTRRQIRDGILKFIEGTWPEFWAWYSAYDHVALCQLFGRMIDLPTKLPMMTMDIKQLHKMAGNPPMPKQPHGLHNALDDARFNVVRYEHLMKLSASV
jgi:hypothetical protein